MLAQAGRPPPCESVGKWLQDKVTRTAMASYVAPILVEEGYAEQVADGRRLRIHFVDRPRR